MITDIPTIPAAVALLIPHRVRVFARRAMNEGALSLLVGFFLLGLAAIFARIAWTSWADYKSALRLAIRQSAAENTPTGDDTRFGVLAQFLGPINANRDQWLPGLRNGTSIEEVAHCLVGRSLAIRCSSRIPFLPDYTVAAEDILNEVLLAFRLGPRDEAFRHRWTIDYARDLERICQNEDLAPLVPVPFGKATTEREKSLGPMLIKAWEPGDRSVLLVPNRTASLLASAPSARSELPVQVASAGKIRDAMQLSSLLDRAVDLVLANSQDRSAAPVQSYFISCDSVLRLWSDGALSTSIQDSFSPTRLWARAHYFDRILQSDDDSYWTPAYTDYAGHGLVFTHSVPVEFSASFGERTFIGVLASDYSIAVDTLLSELSANPLLKTRFAIVPRNGVASWDAVELRAFSGMAGSPSKDAAHFFSNDARWPQEDDPEAIRLKRAIAQRSGGASLTRGVTTLSLGNDEAYFIPVLDLGPERLGAVVLSPQVDRAPKEAQAASILAAVAAGSAVCLVLLAFAQSRKAEAQLTRLTVLRNLQVGVLIVGPEDEILEVNDRAEELLDESLPKTGVWREHLRARRRKFADLIEAQVIVAEKGRDELSVWRYDEIQRERQGGAASSYYVRRRHSGVWYYVAGTPILGHSEPSQIQTFGVIDRVDRKRADELGSILDAFNEEEKRKGARC